MEPVAIATTEESWWEVRVVPFEGRRPIALFQLERLEDAGSDYTLDELDQMECFSLVRNQGQDQVLDGLAYVHPSERRPERGIVAFVWFRESAPPDARLQLRDALDGWARERSLRELVAYSSLHVRQLKKWKERYGFELTRLRELRREVP